MYNKVYILYVYLFSYLFCHNHPVLSLYKIVVQRDQIHFKLWNSLLKSSNYRFIKSSNYRFVKSRNYRLIKSSNYRLELQVH